MDCLYFIIGYRFHSTWIDGEIFEIEKEKKGKEGSRHFHNQFHQSIESEFIIKIFLIGKLDKWWKNGFV